MKQLSDNQYTWIPFYKEFSQKLLQFRNDRKPLVNWIYGNIDGSLIKHFKDDSNGKRVPDTDPFTVMAIINRGITWDKKITLCMQFKEFLNISAPVPQDFSGVPEVNNLLSNFMGFEENRKEGDIERLWNLFECAVLNKDIGESYNALNGQYLIKYNITMGLFWIRPDKYLALDGNNKAKLTSLGIVSFKGSKFVLYKDYKAIMERLDTKMESGELNCKSYAEFSHEAYIQNDGASSRDTASGISNPSMSDVSYWTYSPGEQASKWDLCTRGGVMCIGWDALGDLSKYSTQVDMNQAIKQFYPTDGSAKNDTLAVWQFANEMKPGDIVFAKKGRSTIIGRGVVTSDYIFDDSLANYKHIRKVNWTNVGEWESNDMHAMKTLTNVTRFKDYVNELEGLFDNNYMNSDSQMSMYQEYIDLLLETRNLVLTGAPGTGKTYLAKEIAKAMDAECDFVQFHPSYDYTDFVEGLRPVQKASGEVGFERKDGVFKEFCKKALRNWEDSNKTADEISEEKSFEDRYNELIDRIEDGELNEFKLRTEDKKLEIVKVSDLNNIILQAPATESERTYTVSYNRIAKLAKVFPSIASLNKISNISHEIRAAIGGCNASAYWAVLRELYKQKEFKYKERDVTFMNYNKSIAGDFPVEPKGKSASIVERKKYVFIIDEVNRGEISKIFGELFFSIDPGYRGVDGRVKTQYQNLIDKDDVFYEGFFVPENVYILATMNDIDRSVESMDFAMRRRFTWKEVTPSDTASMLNSLSCSADAKATMHRLNNAIEETEGLGASYMIGPSYFLKLRDNGGDFGKLWRMNIEPLLIEYLRGFRKSAECLRKFRETYFDIQANSETEEIDFVDED